MRYRAWQRTSLPIGLRVLREVAQAGSFSAAAAIARLHAVGRLAPGRGARGDRRPPAVRSRPPGRHADAGGRAPARQRGPGPRRTRRRPARAGRRAGSRAPVRLGAFATAAAGLVPTGAGLAAAGAEGHAAGGDHARADPRPARGDARPGGDRPDAALSAAGRRVARPRAHDAGGARTGDRRRCRTSARTRAAPSRCTSWRARCGSPAGRTPATPCSACGRAWPSVPTSGTSCAIGSPSSRSWPPDWRSPRSPPVMLGLLPDGIAVVAVRGEPQEMRRIVLARRAGPLDGNTARVVGRATRRLSRRCRGPSDARGR